MPDDPLNPIVKLTKAEARRILAAWLGEAPAVRTVRRLTGGCVHTVLEVDFAGEGSPVALKVAHRTEEAGIRREYDVLSYFRRHTDFRVPEPYACDLSGEHVPYSWLAMERLPGTHLAEAAAQMTEEDDTRVQLHLGEAVGMLHTHTRGEGFGHLLSDNHEASWPAYFRERVRQEAEDAWATGLMAEEDRAACDRIIEAVPHHLAHETVPTLVHGDIWATNIMVAGEPGRMEVTGFLDPGGLFADPEYELAYLQIWRTVDERFFAAYTDHQSIADGYELRRLFYWLSTLLLHVLLFKTDTYAQAATDLIRRLAGAL